MDSLQSLLRDTTAMHIRVKALECDPNDVRYILGCLEDVASELRSLIDKEETERQELAVEMAYERRVA